MPPPPPEAAAPEKFPPKLAVGKEGDGFFQPGFLIQMWFVLNHQDLNTAHDWQSYVRARRAELRAKGEIVPKLIGYNVMIDAAKLLQFSSTNVNVQNQTPPPADPSQQERVAVPQPPADTSILQDAYVLAMSEYVDVWFGQFKNLVSWEGYNPSAKVIMPERSLVSRTYGDRRDLGIKAEKKFEHLMYALAVFGGNGPNQPDTTNNQKNVVLRAEVYPIKGTLLGGLVYYAVGDRDAPNTQDRAEADLRIDLANVLFQSEYIQAWDMNATGTDRVEGQGAYAALGYTFLDHVQPVVRVGFLNPNMHAANDGTGVYELGVNYFVKTGESKDEMKLQLSYSLFNNAQNYQNTKGNNQNQVILNAQVAF